EGWVVRTGAERPPRVRRVPRRLRNRLGFGQSGQLRRGQATRRGGGGADEASRRRLIPPTDHGVPADVDRNAAVHEHRRTGREARSDRRPRKRRTAPALSAVPGYSIPVSQSQRELAWRGKRTFGEPESHARVRRDTIALVRQ